jgi:hypothetical protein
VQDAIGTGSAVSDACCKRQVDRHASFGVVVTMTAVAVQVTERCALDGELASMRGRAALGGKISDESARDESVEIDVRARIRVRRERIAVGGQLQRAEAQHRNAALS